MADQEEQTFIDVYFEDKDGNRIESKELIHEIAEYLAEKVTDDDPIASTIMPFVKQITVFAMDTCASPVQTEVIRSVAPFTQVWEGALLSSVMSFLAYNLMHKRGYNIVTEEKPVTEEMKKKLSENTETLMQELQKLGLQVIDGSGLVPPDKDPKGN